MAHIAPTYNTTSFHCPTCGVLAEQTWAFRLWGQYAFRKPNGQEAHENYTLTSFATSKCGHCENYAVWKDGIMIFPTTGTVDHANPDLPDDIQVLYNEARDIVNRSPRGAAALLRLGLQNLCGHLGEKGKNINDDIESLVKKGLPIPVQQALDIIRVTGNHAVHPGTINFEDQAENAYALFGLTNFICNHFITSPKQVAAFYSKLPDKDKQNIAKRDS
jgi:hypothetical protein